MSRQLFFMTQCQLEPALEKNEFYVEHKLAAFRDVRSFNEESSPVGNINGDLPTLHSRLIHALKMLSGPRKLICVNRRTLIRFRTRRRIVYCGSARFLLNGNSPPLLISVLVHANLEPVGPSAGTWAADSTAAASAKQHNGWCETFSAWFYSEGKAKGAQFQPVPHALDSKMKARGGSNGLRSLNTVWCFLVAMQKIAFGSSPAYQ